ncbi:MAG TPA: hypothetical protein VGJ20_33775 [Xanthobacteraceae bacterium]
MNLLSRTNFLGNDERRYPAVPINTLIEKPKTLRWRSVEAMLRVLADGIDLNGGLDPGNIVAPESTRHIEVIVLGVHRGCRLARTVTLRAIPEKARRPLP